MNIFIKEHELDRLVNQHMQEGIHLRELKHLLYRATRQPPYPQNFKPVSLSAGELKQLKADIWQSQLKIFNLAIDIHQMRFGAVPEWLVTARDTHRANFQ